MDKEPNQPESSSYGQHPPLDESQQHWGSNPSRTTKKCSSGQHGEKGWSRVFLLEEDVFSLFHDNERGESR